MCIRDRSVHLRLLTNWQVVLQRFYSERPKLTVLRQTRRLLSVRRGGWVFLISINRIQLNDACRLIMPRHGLTRRVISKFYNGLVLIGFCHDCVYSRTRNYIVCLRLLPKSTSLELSVLSKQM